MTAVSAARKVAFKILMAVGRGQSHSDDLLRGKAVAALSVADRNLATALVLGVLRWQIKLDHQLKPLLKRPNAKLDAEVQISLRLGAFQLLHMDRIPARAAIDESVELAKQAGHRFASGMVNAVLRKLAASTESMTSSNPAQTADKKQEASGHDLPLARIADKRHEASGHDFSRAAAPAQSTRALAPEGVAASDLALIHAHPAWMVERWIAFFGADIAHAICRHGQSQATPTIRLVDPAAEAELTETGMVLEPAELLSSSRRIMAGDIAATAAFREDRVRLQDEGSQLVAEMAGQGSAILDCCAAPGGKTLILAERNPQARIFACEASAPRLAQLRKRLASLGSRIDCRLADATTLSDESQFDLVLADVPCSGTGTLGRNPEIRHRLQPEDLGRQAERQQAILRSALRAVRPGGRVVYSTCSLEPEENEQVVAAVLREVPNARQVPLTPRINALSKADILIASCADRLKAVLTPEGALRIIPGVFHTDGFFIAMLERTV